MVFSNAKPTYLTKSLQISGKSKKEIITVIRAKINCSGVLPKISNELKKPKVSRYCGGIILAAVNFAAVILAVFVARFSDDCIVPLAVKVATTLLIIVFVLVFIYFIHVFYHKKIPNLKNA